MEFYKNDPAAYAFLPVPQSVMSSAPQVSVFAREEGALIYEFPQVEGVTSTDGSPSGYRVLLPWTLVSDGRDFDLDWVIEYVDGGLPQTHQDRQLVQVVTPILSLQEVKSISGWTDETDIKDLERRIRYAIQAYTGQNFGRFRAGMEVGGNGTKRLPLPAPLLGIYAANFSVHNVEVFGGGWFLGTNLSHRNTVGPLSLSNRDTEYYTGAPIVVNAHNAVFRADESYRITGLWGYHDVPGDVKQAARLLAADYSCDESLWRERYIDSVRSGNWRFEVNERAFVGTGNTLADQILVPYRRLTMVMI